MAEDLNNVFLVGRLTRDIEITYTSSGYAIGKLSLAVNRRRKNGEQWEDEANFFDLNLWGKRAESLKPYLLKGTQIAAQGQLKQDRWEQDGQKRSRVLVDLNNIQLLGSRGESSSFGNRNEGSSYNSSSKAPPASFSEPSPAPSGEFEDDIPF